MANNCTAILDSVHFIAFASHLNVCNVLTLTVVVIFNSNPHVSNGAVPCYLLLEITATHDLETSVG